MPPTSKRPLVVGIVSIVASLPGLAAAAWLFFLAVFVAGEDCAGGTYSAGDTVLFWVPACLLVTVTAACVVVTVLWKRSWAGWLTIVLLVVACLTSLLGVGFGVLAVFGTDSC
ncbi:MAG TPA: hypothetical protein VNS81_12450 [Nocardioides sp.]|nr:hypothetical protein [Nocardioides sp.]